MSGLKKAHGFVANSTEDGFLKMSLDDCRSLNRELRMLYESKRDLLEALRLIAGTDFVDAALDPQRAVRVACAAIAKATGEAT